MRATIIKRIVIAVIVAIVIVVALTIKEILLMVIFIAGLSIVAVAAFK